MKKVTSILLSILLSCSFLLSGCDENTVKGDQIEQEKQEENGEQSSQESLDTQEEQGTEGLAYELLPDGLTLRTTLPRRPI